MLAGGLLAGTTALLPPAASGSEAAIFATGAVATAIGAVLLVRRPQIAGVGLGAVALVGTALITISTHEGGVEGGAGDNQILYLWVCLYSFSFLSLRNALVQLAVVGVAYGWLLSEAAVDSEIASTQWLVTMATLLVAGLLVAQLRGSLYRLVAELSRRASRDELTGLLNRGALEERFALERARAIRDQSPLSVLAVDIDEFKPLNDTLGHPIGDAVLRQVATALQHWTREIDAAARIGGDEFAVLLPGAEPADAISVAEDLRSAIARTPGPEGERVTVSVGVTSSPPPAPGFAALWQTADAAMYEAKGSGADQVRFRALIDDQMASGKQAYSQEWSRRRTTASQRRIASDTVE